MGLAMASDIGIALQTGTIAVMLHWRRMVSLASLDFAELGRCLLAAVVSCAGVWVAFGWLGGVVVRQWGSHLPAQSRWTDLIVLLAGTVLWGVLVKWALERAGSALPKVVAQRLGMG
jgi:putative peptidoglycan lipid II flippase